jgi:hypothetical protein
VIKAQLSIQCRALDRYDEADTWTLMAHPSSCSLSCLWRLTWSLLPSLPIVANVYGTSLPLLVPKSRSSRRDEGGYTEKESCHIIIVLIPR